MIKTDELVFSFDSSGVLENFHSSRGHLCSYMLKDAARLCNSYHGFLDLFDSKILRVVHAENIARIIQHNIWHDSISFVPLHMVFEHFKHFRTSSLDFFLLHPVRNNCHWEHGRTRSTTSNPVNPGQHPVQDVLMQCPVGFSNCLFPCVLIGIFIFFITIIVKHRVDMWIVTSKVPHQQVQRLVREKQRLCGGMGSKVWHIVARPSGGCCCSLDIP
mmetsp:Transcript_39792/g.82730  ORF Transcript_39792/g.82730 Transcript_39792/m.82730 type:complete len:216 (+) Transcript_39792:2385-3032(+)